MPKHWWEIAAEQEPPPPFEVMVERVAAELSTTGRVTDWHREWATRLLTVALNRTQAQQEGE